MTRNFILILLVTLSIVNAIPHQLYKRTTTFGPCQGVPFINVTISPDPVIIGQDITFDVSGRLNEDVPTNPEMYIHFDDGVDVTIYTVSNMSLNIYEVFTEDLCQPKGI